MIFAVYFLGDHARLGASEWASWVQAVGSISAILISLGLANYQIERQKDAERLREAQNDLRIANFAEAVIREALDAVRAEATAQKSWPDGTGYIFHGRSRIQAAQILLRTLTTEPLFTELINPVIDLHSLLVDVESAGVQLIGQGTFKSNSKFTQFWALKENAMDTITIATTHAMGIAHAAAQEAA